MGRPRRRRIILAVVALLIAVVAYFPARATLFPTRFDVPSIAATPQYQDPVLLDRAWALPVASIYGRHVLSQTNGSVCGAASLANALRSLGDRDATQDTVLDGTGKCRIGVCIPGVTLDELAEIARADVQSTKAPAKPTRVTVVRDITLDQFRDHLKRTNDPARRYIVNFHRGLLFGKGVGHHSPIAGYLEAEDLALVLDVNGAFGPWLVSSERLFRAVDSVDSSSGKKRGLLVIE